MAHSTSYFSKNTNLFSSHKQEVLPFFLVHLKGVSSLKFIGTEGTAETREQWKHYEK